MEKLIGIKELSQILGCKEQTIRNKLSLGIFPIPTYKVLGRLKWKESEVRNYLNELKGVNTPEKNPLTKKQGGDYRILVSDNPHPAMGQKGGKGHGSQEKTW